MHEIEFANKIIEEAKKYGKVKSVVVEVGELAPISLKNLKDAMKMLVDWDIKMILKKGLVKCDCGYEGEPKVIEKQHSFTLFICPECSAQPRILNGKDIVLKEVKIG